ncbi:hypothetical protein CLV78_102117 [Aliiruegeria haliotis]|uniref:J domain-containing protein n=1 Tax=Aliiruegeria haliotis TaxID=1280846 RepID=A0A2T0RUV5_9RHOB|nr:J domain-containing protein [Aliiruegeria haliotis]PRY24944.1 hypothetical protein CLV78_102117 [Aliiruegeria haliotis]
MSGRAEGLVADIGALRPGLPPEELRKIYRRLARRYHPDAGSERASREAMARINATYDALRRADRDPGGIGTAGRDRAGEDRRAWDEAMEWAEAQERVQSADNARGYPSARAPSRPFAQDDPQPESDPTMERHRSDAARRAAEASWAHSGGAAQRPEMPRADGGADTSGPFSGGWSGQPEDSGARPSARPGQNTRTDQPSSDASGAPEIPDRMVPDELLRAAMQDIALTALDDWLEHAQGLPRDPARRRMAVALGLRLPGHCPALHLPREIWVEGGALCMGCPGPLEPGPNILVLPVCGIEAGAIRPTGSVQALLRDVPHGVETLEISATDWRRYGFRLEASTARPLRLQFDMQGEPAAPELCATAGVRYRGVFR